jgi:hypothetical protein
MERNEMSLDYPNRADWLKVRATKVIRTTNRPFHGATIELERNVEKRSISNVKDRIDMLANRRLRQRQAA